MLTAELRDNPLMGIAFWLLSGAVAGAVARIVPLARPARWLGELSVTVSAAFLLGVAATALDFGGWREPDWRAALFAFLGALAAAALFRLTITRTPGGPT
jgi:uncharacterized membrane protein YeaQ/YmgE (transglycosylase-associated protein family)